MIPSLIAFETGLSEVIKPIEAPFRTTFKSQSSWSKHQYSGKDPEFFKHSLVETYKYLVNPAPLIVHELHKDQQ